MLLVALAGTVVSRADDTSTRVILESDFSTEEGTAGWTALDESGKPGVTWAWKSNCFYVGPPSYGYVPAVRLLKDWDSGHNDYYVSPAVELKAGETYTITTSTGYNAGSATIDLEVGTSATDASTFTSVARLTPTENGNAAQTETATYTATADGTYYFAYHGKEESAGNSYLFLFNFKVEAPESSGPVDPGEPGTDPEEKTTVLDADFATEEGTTGWSALDASAAPGVTWAWKSNCFYVGPPSYGYVPAVRLLKDWDSNHNDYYVSPAVELTEGKTYTITTSTGYNAGSATIDLEVGTSATDASSFTSVARLNPTENGNAVQTETITYTAPASGTYYFAYHGQEAASGGSYLFLFGFKVEAPKGETPQPEQPTPADVEDLTAAVNYDDNTVTLSWNNPTKDADGNDLTDKVGAVVYNGETVVTTIDELSGETTTTTVAPEPFEGQVTYTVKAFIGEHFADGVSVTADLNKPVPPVVAKDIPYNADLTSAETAAEFTTIDANSDAITWGTAEGIEGITYNSDEATVAANDWIVTPLLKFEAAQNYAIRANFARRGAFDADVVEVCVGDEASADHLTQVVTTLNLSEENGLEQAVRYICSSDTTLYVGFHLVTPNAENGQLSLLSVAVSAIDEATPQAVANLEAKANSDEKNVTLTWTNPTKDTEGYPLVETVGAKVYANEQLVATLDELEGETTTFVDAPETFAGKVTYTVVAFIGDREAALASTEVNLDDKEGELVLVKDFSQPFDKEEWTIINGGGNGVWQHDYSDDFYFNYQRGGATEDDWLITPTVLLGAQDRYVVKYQLKTSRDYDASLEVTVGEGATAYAQDQVIASYPNLKQNGFANFETAQFSVPEDGWYNIGFHVLEAYYSVDVCKVAVYCLGDPTVDGVRGAQIGVVAYNRGNGQLLVPAGSRVEVFAVNGAQVLNTVATGEAFNLNQLSKGIYVLQVTDAQGHKTSQKIVK